ncbi:MAG: ArsR family transcriptional regulator [Phycisphaerales bacterium]
MPTDLPSSHTITDAETMWTIASPARIEIMNAACALGECSAGEIAEMTGRSRTSLYPHIEQLVAAGILHESGTRPSGKRQEQLYRPIALFVKTRHNADDPDVVAYHVAYGKAVARMLAREFERGITQPKVTTSGPLRDTFCTSQTFWADDDMLTEVNTLLDRITEICSHSQPGTGKRLMQLGVLTTPLLRNQSGSEDNDALD